MIDDIKPKAVRIERGAPFRCYCACHSPIGFELWPGQVAPPVMRPCDVCVEFHP
jgi:hypothetical protein